MCRRGFYVFISTEAAAAATKLGFDVQSAVYIRTYCTFEVPKTAECSRVPLVHPIRAFLYLKRALFSYGIETNLLCCFLFYLEKEEEQTSSWWILEDYNTCLRTKSRWSWARKSVLILANMAFIGQYVTYMAGCNVLILTNMDLTWPLRYSVLMAYMKIYWPTKPLLRARHGVF